MMKKTKQKRAESSNSEEEASQLFDAEQDRESLNNSIQSSTSNKRGRPEIPKKWTRVISFSQDDLETVKVYDLASDLLLGNAM
jgi:hypothetical protein